MAVMSPLRRRMVEDMTAPRTVFVVPVETSANKCRAALFRSFRDGPLAGLIVHVAVGAGVAHAQRDQQADRREERRVQVEAALEPIDLNQSATYSAVPPKSALAMA